MVYYVLFWFIHKVYIVKIPLLKQFNTVFRNSQSIVFHRIWCFVPCDVVKNITEPYTTPYIKIHPIV